MTPNAPSTRRPADHDARMERVQIALEGLSVGDAFGQQFFYFPQVEAVIAERAVPQPPWHYTDDTEMALGITEVLDRHGGIDADTLAGVFARRYRERPRRGYGATAQDVLQAIGEGLHWSAAASSAFGGEGSMGNGAAMRVAPVGAYFADEFAAAVAAALASAAVTHCHPDGQAGAVAVAAAAAWAWQARGQPGRSGSQLFDAVLDVTPDSDTRQGILRARQMGPEVPPQTAASVLGSGWQVISSDTVPFALWCAARHLGDYVEALWTTVAGLGDRDTTCAIVGGIVALSAGRESIPQEWVAAREPLLLGEG
jgi:ADP-ribosylglycohydrolase